MKKRAVLISVITLICIGFASYPSLAADKIEDPQKALIERLECKEKDLLIEREDEIWGIEDGSIQLKEDGTGEIMPPLIRDYEPYFEANIDLSEEQLFDIFSVIDKKKLAEDGARFIRIELMTLKEYCERFSLEDVTSSPQISPDRLLWVVQLYYAVGYETRGGFIKNALVTGRHSVNDL